MWEMGMHENSPQMQQICHLGMPLSGYCPVSYIWGHPFGLGVALRREAHVYSVRCLQYVFSLSVVVSATVDYVCCLEHCLETAAV